MAISKNKQRAAIAVASTANIPLRLLTIASIALLLACSTVAFGAGDQSDADSALEEVRFNDEVKRVEADNAQKLEDHEQAQADYEQKFKDVQSQQEAMRKAQQEKQEKAQMAQILGQTLIMAGSLAMMAGQQKAGMWLMGGGMAASLAGTFMGMNANKSGSSADDLSSLTPPEQPELEDVPTRGSGGGINPGDGTFGSASIGNGAPSGDQTSSGTPTKLSIDPAALRTGKVGQIADQFEKATGINRDDFANAIAEGVSPAALLDGVNGLNGNEIQAGLDSAAGSFSGPGGASNIAALAEEVGVGDLAGDLSGSSSTDWSGGGRGIAGGGGAAAGGSPPSLAGLNFGNAKEEDLGNSSQAFKLDPSKMHPEVRKKYEQSLRQNNSLFAIVHRRYQVYSPMLLGYGPTRTNASPQAIARD